MIALAVLPAACSYQAVRYRAGQDAVLSVWIRTFANDTLEPGVELMLGRALRREFLRAGPIRLVEDAASADYSISGRVNSVETASRSFSTGVRALEFRLIMRVRIEVTASDERGLPIRPLALAESEIYLASADIEVSRKNREEALRRLAGLLASRIYDELELREWRAENEAQ